MKVTPILSRINKFNKPLNNRRNVINYGVCFQGKIPTTFKSSKKLELLNGLRQKFQSLFIRSDINILAREDVEKILSMSSVGASLAFYNLYEKAPKFSKVLIDSGRLKEFQDYDIEYFLDLYEENLLTEKRGEAFSRILEAKLKQGDYIGGATILYDVLTDFADDEDLDLIIKHSDKINEMFSNTYVRMGAAVRYIEAARAFENSDVTPVDLARCISLLDSDVDYMVQWAGMEKKSRDKLLDLISQSEFLKTLFQDANEITINDKLLEKVEFLDNNKEEMIELYADGDVSAVLLQNQVTKNSLEKILSILKKLPSDTRQYIINHELAHSLFTFEEAKGEGRISYDVTIEDIAIFLEILAKYDPDNKLSFDGELAIVPSMTNEAQEVFKKNLEEMFELHPPRCDVNSAIFIKNLFNNNFKEKFNQINQVLYNNDSYLSEELGLRCANKNPEFANRVMQLLHHPTFNIGLVDIPCIEEKGNLVKSLFVISKLQLKMLNQAVQEKINVFSNSERAKTYYELLLTDTEQARVFKMRARESEEVFLMEGMFNAYNEVFAPHQMRNLINLISVTDAEFANIYLDRGHQTLREKAKEINSLNYKTKEFMSDVFKHAKVLDNSGTVIKLSGKQKITLATIISSFHNMLGETLESSLKESKTMLRNKSDYVLDYEGFIKKVYNSLLDELGSYTDEQKDKILKTWDLNYLHVLLSPYYYDDENLKLCYELLFNDEFNDYITNSDTKHGYANKQTSILFNDNGLDYETWVSGIEKGEIVVNGQSYSIGLLDKSGSNSLFMGNYTNCCTGLDSSNGFSVPIYLLHSAFNVLAVRDKNGAIVATSRVFISKLPDKKPALIIDNIEIANELKRKLNTDNEKQFAQDVWNYIVSFADSFSDEKINVLMATKNKRLSTPDVPSVNESIKLLGSVVDDIVYINSKGWITDVLRKQYLEFLQVM